MTPFDRGSTGRLVPGAAGLQRPPEPRDRVDKVPNVESAALPHIHPCEGVRAAIDLGEDEPIRGAEFGDDVVEENVVG